MDDRKSDIRIYIVSFLFFFCIAGGGTFLGLYIFLPATLSKSWYPAAGLVMVAIPWFFWLLIYLYRCVIIPIGEKLQYRARQLPKVSPARNSIARVSNARSSTDRLSSMNSPKSAGVNSPNGQEKRVHFGAVVVMDGNQKLNNNPGGALEFATLNEVDNEGGWGEESHRTMTSMDTELSVASRESEAPLTFSVSS